MCIRDRKKTDDKPKECEAGVSEENHRDERNKLLENIRRRHPRSNPEEEDDIRIFSRKIDEYKHNPIKRVPNYLIKLINNYFTSLITIPIQK